MVHVLHGTLTLKKIKVTTEPSSTHYPTYTVSDKIAAMITVIIMGSCFDCAHRAAAMWIQVRTMDGKETHRVDSLSKLTKVDELRVKIMELFKVEPERQRLFYRGKQVRQHGCDFI